MKKKKTEKRSPSTKPRRTAGIPRPDESNQDPDRHEKDRTDQETDEREIIRKNAKPRSARQSLKGPNNRKKPSSRK